MNSLIVQPPYRGVGFISRSILNFVLIMEGLSMLPSVTVRRLF